jgi:hypothetical protein
MNNVEVVGWVYLVLSGLMGNVSICSMDVTYIEAFEVQTSLWTSALVSCLDSSTLSPRASLAAVARLPREASLSLATD